MEDWVNASTDSFKSYVHSFKDLTADQQKNFDIKEEHSLRVAENCKKLAVLLKLEDEDEKAAVLAGIFHDIGRFRQLLEYNTFNDAASIDHAMFAVGILKEKEFLGHLNEKLQEVIFTAISFHNKLEIPKKLNGRELLHTRLLRDADKLDIYKVLTDYYSDRNQIPNHTLTWELPKATGVSPGAAREVLAGKLVSKDEIKSEMDVKIMQLSWVYDMNFKPSIHMIFRERYLEKIYNSLPKNDMVFEIYRKVKVFAENKLLE